MNPRGQEDHARRLDAGGDSDSNVAQPAGIVADRTNLDDSKTCGTSASSRRDSSGRMTRLRGMQVVFQHVDLPVAIDYIRPGDVAPPARRIHATHCFRKLAVLMISAGIAPSATILWAW